MPEDLMEGVARVQIFFERVAGSLDW